MIRSLAAAAALLALTAVPALAGGCPADAVRAGAVPPGPSAPVGVVDTVLGSIDLGPQYQVPGRAFRLRRLEIAPGGVVPWHSHAERPAHIFVLKGEILEHRSDCAQPIRHREGELAIEAGEYSHWWKNESRKPVVLLSADILPPAGKPEESM